MGQICDKYGFFNGIYGIEQANWADYWKGVIPDGVVAGSGMEVSGHKEMEVYYSGGMAVNVAPGEAMVDNHKAWIMTRKHLTFDDADAEDPRIDSVILRVIYGNDGESVIELDVKKGKSAQNPVPPTLTQVTGTEYEYSLADIYIRANTGNILSGDITDKRYVFSMAAGAITPFKEETLYDDDQRVYKECILNVLDGREYRATNTITNEIIINLPTTPVSTFMCELDFTTGRDSVEETVDGEKITTEFEFNAITFKRNNADYRIRCSNLLITTGARYNLLIWWDGVYYWADCKVAS